MKKGTTVEARQRDVMARIEATRQKVLAGMSDADRNQALRQDAYRLTHADYQMTLALKELQSLKRTRVTSAEISRTAGRYGVDCVQLARQFSGR